MSEFWATFVTFWADYGPYIGAAVVPTIITGLTISPKTAGAAPWVQKIWDGLKMVLDFLSVLTHKDKPGTFQLPLKAGKLLEKKEVPPAVVLLFVVGISSTQASCAWWKKNSGEVKQVAKDCTLSSAREQAGPLMNTLVGIYTGASEGTWKKQVGSLAKTFGWDTIQCASKYALEKIVNPVQSEADPETLKSVATARHRAMSVEHGWVYVE